MRTATLFKLFLLETLHRLRHDWARELVALIASSVLFATFLYIFNDFLNVEVASLSPKMRDAFAYAALAVVAGVASVFGGRMLRDERTGDETISRAARLMGEEPQVLKAYAAWRAVATLAVTHGAAWLLILKMLARPEWPVALGIEAAMVALSVLNARLPARDVVGAATSATADSLLAATSPVATLTLWRIAQLRRRGGATKVAAFGALALLALDAIAAMRAAPPFALFVMALAAGYLAALLLVYLMADDLPHGWTEKGAGVTHDNFIRAYERLGWRIGLATGGGAALVTFLGRLIDGAASASTGLDAAKVLVVAALPAIVAPWLLLQIDGRRVGVNGLLVFIATLFLGTAIFASWVSLLLPPFLRYFALQYQAGRFYRA